MKYYCNPVNINYRYQFNMEPGKSKPSVSREAADPTMLHYRGKYYIFASMTLGVWVSEDLVHWKNHRLPDNTGAGHGSTMTDQQGNMWHASTMRISVNHRFERRVGIWPAGLDQDGELFCNQRYGDWPMSVEAIKMDPWRNPDWYLLSYGKKMIASSFDEDKTPDLAADENIRTWWRAASSRPGEWIQMDLGSEKEVHGIQVNFADD